MPKKVALQLTHLQKVRMLYKTILRLHRGLPAEMQALGDNYTKDEFRRHMKCNPTEANLFMTEWTKYTLTLSKQLGLKGKSKHVIGNDLQEDTLNYLRDEQVVQLYELLKAARGENDEANSEVENVQIVDNNKSK